MKALGFQVPYEIGFYQNIYQMGVVRGVQLPAQTELPYKAAKAKSLDEEEKEYNRALSRPRVVVEHVIGDMKIFKILCGRYRNKHKYYVVKFKIIAGIVNLRMDLDWHKSIN